MLNYYPKNCCDNQTCPTQRAPDGWWAPPKSESWRTVFSRFTSWFSPAAGNAHRWATGAKERNNNMTQGYSFVTMEKRGLNGKENLS